MVDIGGYNEHMDIKSPMFWVSLFLVNVVGIYFLLSGNKDRPITVLQPTPTPQATSIPFRQQPSVRGNSVKIVEDNAVHSTATPTPKSTNNQVSNGAGSQTYQYPTVAPYKAATFTPYPTTSPIPTITPTQQPYVLPKENWYYCSNTNENWCLLHQSDSTVPRSEYEAKCYNRTDVFYCVHGGTKMIAGVVRGLQDLSPNDCVCIK